MHWIKIDKDNLPKGRILAGNFANGDNGEIYHGEMKKGGDFDANDVTHYMEIPPLSEGLGQSCSIEEINTTPYIFRVVGGRRLFMIKYGHRACVNDGVVVGGSETGLFVWDAGWKLFYEKPIDENKGCKGFLITMAKTIEGV